MRSYIEALVKDKCDIAVCIKKIQSGEIFSLSGSDIFDSASIIKLYYLYATLYEVDRGRLKLEDLHYINQADCVGGYGVIQFLSHQTPLQLIDLLYLMICISDNTATNMIYDIVGKNRINLIVSNLGLIRTKTERKIMHEVTGLRNMTTVEDTCVILEHLYSDVSLSKESIKLAKDILGKQQLNNLLSSDWNSECVFYHKTGEDEGLLHDAGVINLESGDYSVAVFTNGWSDLKHGEEVMGKLGKVLLSALGKGEFFI